MSELLGRISKTCRTNETMAEYLEMPKTQQDESKDVGAFVGGKLKDGRRKKENVERRSVVSLDGDNVKSDTWIKIKSQFKNAIAMYTTHKHQPGSPRMRIIIPLSREVLPEEYQAIARMIAKLIGIEQFDEVSYNPAQLMYWPSTCSDGEFIFDYQDGPWLNPDEILAMYTNWQDMCEWPVSSRQKDAISKSIGKKQADPTSKDNNVGLFCRAYYHISVAIDEHLPEVYSPCDVDDRYTFTGGTTHGGVVIYDDLFAYSHHASDPASGKLCNAFDLIRIHRFGVLDTDVEEGTPTNKLPSFRAMLDFVTNDTAVKRQLAEERKAAIEASFSCEDWKDGLEITKKGAVVDSLSNLILIMSKDPRLKGIVYNEHRDGMEIIGEVPWKHPDRWWRDADDAQLISYIDREYGLFSKIKYNTAITKVTDDKSYHPIKEYLNSLPEWDKVPRLDTLLIDYFGAEDHEYVRAVTRKTLCAAVARVFQPGIKFDFMLVLNGKQGAGKSTFFRKIGGPWFNDSLSLSDTRDKTAAEKLQGFWILEIGEMAGMKKTDVETLKGFISRQDDVYRAAFGRRAVPHSRQCIFVGTTNAERGFLRDITGNRRFWPVKLGTGTKQSWNMTEDEVAQIWAEVMVRYQDGEKLCLPENLEQYAEAMQRDALESDEREGLIEAYLEKLLPDNWENQDMLDRRNYFRDHDLLSPQGTEPRQTVCVLEIWNEALGNLPSTLKRTDSFEITGIMKKLDGWESNGKVLLCGPYGKQKVFERIGNQKATKI